MKTCRLCNQDFEITEGDLAFHKKASPMFGGNPPSAFAKASADKLPSLEKGGGTLIPPPTLCPPCRNMRRMAWRNERSLYNAHCELCGRDTISVFRPQDPPRKAYCHRCYYTDKWDPLSSGRDYDLSVSLSENFSRLLKDVPLMMLYQSGVNENCDYMNFAGGGGCKNCYLIFNSGKDEDCYYARGLIESKDCMDMLLASRCQGCYECMNCDGCYRLFFGRNCSGCNDSAFLFNCIGCRNCIGCTNLRHAEYQIFNQPCTKEQYAEFMARLGSHQFAEAAKKRFQEIVRDSIHRENNNINAEDCTGDYMVSSKNCHDCFEGQVAEDCKHITGSKHCRDCYDTFGFGYDSELLYEDVAVGYSTRSAFCLTCEHISDSYYCMYCRSSPNCFACIGLMQKQYCILNKQYTKEEYEELAPRIIAQMQSEKSKVQNGNPNLQSSIDNVQFGEFFPPSLSPFGYNETVGMEYAPMTKEEALAKGFHWSDYVAPPPRVEKVVKASQLPDSIFDIPDPSSEALAKGDSILDWAVECEVTGKPFKVIRPELKFLRENNLPFPRRHPDTRHFDRVAMRNPRQLFDRACSNCGKAMKTSYAPKRPERVFCEECYRKEVY